MTKRSKVKLINLSIFLFYLKDLAYKTTSLCTADILKLIKAMAYKNERQLRDKNNPQYIKLN